MPRRPFSAPTPLSLMALKRPEIKPRTPRRLISLPFPCQLGAKTLTKLARSSPCEGNALPRSTDNRGTDPSRAILLYKQTNLREIAASLSMPIHSMAWRFLSGAQMNEVIAKRLALNMALMCVRNTCIEDVHAGVEPSSKAVIFPMQSW
jgi:hypothetical protein